MWTEEKTRGVVDENRDILYSNASAEELKDKRVIVLGHDKGSE